MVSRDDQQRLLLYTIKCAAGYTESHGVSLVLNLLKIGICWFTMAIIIATPTHRLFVMPDRVLTGLCGLFSHSNHVS